MKNFIFDVDGTLVDSYKSIINNIIITNKHFDVEDSYEFIYEQIIRSTSTEYFQSVCSDNLIPFEEYIAFYDSLDPNLKKIQLIPKVRDTLEFLSKNGCKLFIFTHRGNSLDFVLTNLNIKEYFTDCVGINQGFKKKPSGEGITYLVNKHNLTLEDTCYVGDREIDVLAAKEANVISVFFESSGYSSITPGDITIYSFDELKKL